MNLEKYIKDIDDAPVPGKSQYVRSQMVFTCPCLCGFTENSNRFAFYSYFEDACKDHVEKCHPNYKEHTSENINFMAEIGFWNDDTIMLMGIHGGSTKEDYNKIMALANAEQQVKITIIVEEK